MGAGEVLAPGRADVDGSEAAQPSARRGAEARGVRLEDAGAAVSASVSRRRRPRRSSRSGIARRVRHQPVGSPPPQLPQRRARPGDPPAAAGRTVPSARTARRIRDLARPAPRRSRARATATRRALDPPPVPRSAGKTIGGAAAKLFRTPPPHTRVETDAVAAPRARRLRRSARRAAQRARASNSTARTGAAHGSRIHSPAAAPTREGGRSAPPLCGACARSEALEARGREPALHLARVEASQVTPALAHPLVVVAPKSTTTKRAARTPPAPLADRLGGRAVVEPHVREAADLAVAKLAARRPRRPSSTFVPPSAATSRRRLEHALRMAPRSRHPRPRHSPAICRVPGGDFGHAQARTPAARSRSLCCR